MGQKKYGTDMGKPVIIGNYGRKNNNYGRTDMGKPLFFLTSIHNITHQKHEKNVKDDVKQSWHLVPILKVHFH